MRELARTVRFRPYSRGNGPSFTLRTYWTGRIGEYGKNVIGYELRMHEAGARKPVVLFDADDFQGHCDADQNACIEGIMGFLTLRPGDTDDEYFADYTDAQRSYCEQHAEQLSGEVSCRFQCPECGAALTDSGRCGSHGSPRAVIARQDRERASAVHSHTTTGFCPVCIAPGGGCHFAR